MKIGTRARYALHLIVTIARQPDANRPVDITTISRRTGLSRRYLEQLAIDLKKAGLLTATRGRGGGYLIAKPVEEIKIRDIVEATNGRVGIVHCVADPLSCLKSEFCECRMVWLLINRQIREALGQYTLADLKDPRRLAGLTRQFDSCSRRRSPS